MLADRCVSLLSLHRRSGETRLSTFSLSLSARPGPRALTRCMRPSQQCYSSHRSMVAQLRARASHVHGLAGRASSICSLTGARFAGMSYQTSDASASNYIRSLQGQGGQQGRASSGTGSYPYGVASAPAPAYNVAPTPHVPDTYQGGYSPATVEKGYAHDDYRYFFVVAFCLFITAAPALTCVHAQQRPQRTRVAEARGHPQYGGRLAAQGTVDRGLTGGSP